MSAYETLKTHLQSHKYTWLVTGVAGFIGSNLLEALLQLNQKVVGLDNFSTGSQHNLNEVQSIVGPSQWQNFSFMQEDICNLIACQIASTGVDFVLHQAALGSVPRSVEDPINTNASNVTGFLNMLVASRNSKVKRCVYAASSSTYGDHPSLPKVEEQIGKPLSPYAVTKYVNELYADIFAKTYGLNSVGLRYFNVFGPRQDPNGAYAAVIPKWIVGMINAEPIYINGDGETSRDFCFVTNAVQANLLAATVDSLVIAERGKDYAGKATFEEVISGPKLEHTIPFSNVYNIAVGDRTTLNNLFEQIIKILLPSYPHLKDFKPTYSDFRAGDVRHSLADIRKASAFLGYEPTHRISAGLEITLPWYIRKAIRHASG